MDILYPTNVIVLLMLEEKIALIGYQENFGLVVQALR